MKKVEEIERKSITVTVEIDWYKKKKRRDKQSELIAMMMNIIIHQLLALLGAFD